ncbi:MAG: membrane protein insertase YidC [Phenylobacterium sp.]
MQNDSKNTFIFIVLAMAMIMAYQMLVLGPATKRRQEQQRAQAAAAAQAPQGPIVPQASITVPREQALAASPRVPIDTPTLTGSIALKGGKVDDLFLKRYRQTLDANSPLVELFRPKGAANAYFTSFGWIGANLPGLPGDDTVWTLAKGSRLTPETPVILTYRSPAGLVFVRTLSVDQLYMIHVTDTVVNQGGQQVSIAPFATVERQGLPTDIYNVVNVHQGAVGWLGEKPDLKQTSYKAWKKKPLIEYPSKGGWLGITDKYWLAALVPTQGDAVRATFRVTPSQGVDIYDAGFTAGYRTIAPGRQVSVTTLLFAGAKTVPVIQRYMRTLGVPEFDRAVDWGRLFFLTRPIFQVLEFFYHHVGNFGVAILLLTICIRLVMFWPAQKSYESMTKMKKVQPELDKIRARHKDDPQKLLQEMAALYQREKINPFLGCLPMLATIPVFLSLFKVLSVTIEMRHAPFVGFVNDLSARDPTTLWNLFGLLPYDPGVIPFVGGLLNGPLHLGVWALLYGFTMWLTTAMSPQTGMDPTQQKMMQYMPLIFTFFMSGFAVGLLIYYTWSNCLSLLQQYVIMRRFKVDNPIDGIIRRIRGAAAAPTG